MGHPPILKLTNADTAFYPTIGPFLSRRHIVKEVGGPLWDEDEKTWWAAMDGNTVLGIAAARPIAGRVKLMSAYTLPEYRRQGVHRALLSARMAEYPGQPFRATCTQASLPLYLATGFTITRVHGAFTEVHHDQP